MKYLYKDEYVNWLIRTRISTTVLDFTSSKLDLDKTFINFTKYKISNFQSSLKLNNRITKIYSMKVRSLCTA